MSDKPTPDMSAVAMMNYMTIALQQLGKEDEDFDDILLKTGRAFGKSSLIAGEADNPVLVAMWEAAVHCSPDRGPTSHVIYTLFPDHSLFLDLIHVDPDDNKAYNTMMAIDVDSLPKPSQILVLILAMNPGSIVDKIEEFMTFVNSKDPKQETTT